MFLSVRKAGYKMKTPLILVSNDDGVDARGIRTLARAMKELGRVVVVAPDGQRSAAAHSITLHRPLRVTKISKDVYSTDGTPTDCVMLAVHEILKERPDLVVSGINHGPNLGDDVHYSGTVAAAHEAGIVGIPAIAFSLMMDSGRNFAAAGEFAKVIAKKVLRQGLPRDVILNVNVPDLPAEKIKGVEFVKQGKRDWGDIVVEKVDPRGRKYYWIGGDEDSFEDIYDSDCNAVLGGKISVTPLRVNITDKNALKELQKWRLSK
jgi:5'-nucleotidase